MKVPGSLIVGLLLCAGALGGCGSSSPGNVPGVDAGGGPGGASPNRDAGGGGASGDAPIAADGGTGGVGDAGADSGADAGSATACSDLFAPVLQTYSIDISATDWAAIQAEFLYAGGLVETTFVNYQPAYYPIVFHFGGQTTNAYMRLKGDSSWREAVALYGSAGKMQFVVAFDHIDSKAAFHGVGKLSLDMPPTDLTFMHDRVGNTWMRSLGIAALCASNARLEINGTYYGLYTTEERMGHRLLVEYFPNNADNDLFKGGWTPETNTLSPNWTRLRSFWDATTPAAVAAIVDLPQSFLTWAAEALLNDGDGYWGGDHNFYLYDQGTKGYVFLPNDLDSILDYLGEFDGDPVCWWSSRPGVQFIGQHYLVLMNDPTMRGKFANALATQLSHYDVATIQSWIDKWSAQIRDSVAADPHKPSTTSVAVFDEAVALARQGIKGRADHVRSWLACEQTGQGEDKDGDGYIWCKDCRDDDSSIHPGAHEVCGNATDDNCNGYYDEGCSSSSSGSSPGANGGAGAPDGGGAD